MSRYTGPRVKVMRALGLQLPGLSRKVIPEQKVNGRTVNIPSARVRSGDVIAPRERSRDHPSVLDALQNPPLTRPEWISFDETQRAATVTHLPSDVLPPFPVELQQVVEYYATRL